MRGAGRVTSGFASHIAHSDPSLPQKSVKMGQQASAVEATPISLFVDVPKEVGQLRYGGAGSFRGMLTALHSRRRRSHGSWAPRVPMVHCSSIECRAIGSHAHVHTVHRIQDATGVFIRSPPREAEPHPDGTVSFLIKGKAGMALLLLLLLLLHLDC